MPKLSEARDMETKNNLLSNGSAISQIVGGITHESGKHACDNTSNTSGVDVVIYQMYTPLATRGTKLACEPIPLSLWSQSWPSHKSHNVLINIPQCTFCNRNLHAYKEVHMVTSSNGKL